MRQVLAGHLADDVHDLLLVRPLAALVDDRERALEALRGRRLPTPPASGETMTTSLPVMLAEVVLPAAPASRTGGRTGC